MRHTISCLHAIIIMGQLLKIIFSYIVCQSWLISSQGWSMLHMALSHAAVESRSDQECKSRNEHTLKKKKTNKKQPRVIKEFWELVQYHRSHYNYVSRFEKRVIFTKFGTFQAIGISKQWGTLTLFWSIGISGLLLHKSNVWNYTEVVAVKPEV